MKKNSVLRKVLAVALSAVTIFSTGFTAVGTYVGTSGISVSAAQVYGDFEYNVNNDNTITITKYKGNGGDVVIPDIIYGNSVTSIGEWAFDSCTSLKSIIIPNSVTSIKNGAFLCCENLTSITIPDSVTLIEYGAGVFALCKSLISIAVGENNTAYSSDNGVLFNKDKTKIICCPQVKTGKYVIPNSVTSIDSFAFRDCTGLTSITIPDSVTLIGDGAFQCCESLKSITIPDSVTSIVSSAFYRCTGLTSITIPDSVTSIGDHAFSGCTSLTSMTIPDSVTSIDEYAFSGCTGLRSVTIGNKVTSIGNSAFKGCTGLKSVTIGNKVTSIGDYAFSSCTSLTSIEIPDSVTSIGNRTFSGCTGLTGIIIPNSVTSIGSLAFEGWKSLTICGTKDSYVETYANERGIPFVKFTSYIEGLAPTCTEDGKKGYYHNKFSGVDYEDKDCTIEISDIDSWGIIPAPGHNYTAEIIAPTCTTQGYTIHTCSKCGDHFTNNYTDTIDHNYILMGENVTSCTVDKVKVYMCSYCHEQKTETTKAPGHNYTTEIIPPTCTTQGWTVHTCLNCGEVRRDTFTDATGHNYELLSKQTLTCTENGIYIYQCSKCNGMITFTIKSTGHNYTTEMVAPTTEKEGYTLHTCENCGENYKDNYTAKLLANRSVLSAETISLGGKITVTATATGGTEEYLYQVLYKKKTQSKWTIAQDFGINDTVTIKPANVDDYDICVKVKDSTGKVVKKYFEVKVNAKLINMSTLSADNIILGQKVTVNCLAQGGVGEYQYQIVYKQTPQSKWTTAQAFSENATVTFKPAKATSYDVCVKVKDSNGTIVKKFFTVQVNAKLTNTSTVSATEIQKGNMVTVNGSATGGSGNYTYAVYYKQKAQSSWTTKQSFNENSNVSIKPAQATDYDICVKVKDKDGTIVKKYFTVTVTK